ncbi:MAG: hypothetical protein NVSMB29_11830 [Candidatus Dormibacteria bacterium]
MRFPTWSLGSAQDGAPVRDVFPGLHLRVRVPLPILGTHGVSNSEETTRMRLLGRALLALVAGLALGLLGAVLLSPGLRSCALSLIRGGSGVDPDAEEDALPNIVLRSPGGEPASLSRAVAEGVAAASGVQPAQPGF